MTEAERLYLEEIIRREEDRKRSLSIDISTCEASLLRLKKALNEADLIINILNRELQK